ncbi:MAG: MFS transporter, partial [Thermoplasmata archaeon]
MAPFNGSSVNVALPSLAAEFHIDAVSLSWVPTLYLLAVSVFLLPAGKLGDIRGRVPIYISGAVIFTLSSASMMFTASFPFFLGMRIVQGTGAAMIFATGTAILMDIVPKEQKGKYLGITVAFTYTGLTAGPFLGGLLT